MFFQAGILATALLLAPQDGGSASLEQDAKFALQLTSQLGFENFSEIVLDEALAKANSREDRSAVLLARCQVLELVTRRPAGPAEQIAALQEAGRAYMDFLATEPSGEQGLLAQRQLGAVANSYAEKLNAYLPLLTSDPGERATMITEAEEMFGQGLTQLNLLIRWWNGIQNPDVKEGAKYIYLYPASFYQALIYLHWGVLYPPNSVEREDNVARSIDLLTSFAFSAGEMSTAGLMAYRHLADGYVALGNIEDAEEFYYFIIEEGISPDALSVMQASELRARRAVQQDAFLGLFQALSQAGRGGEIPALSSTFQEWVSSNRVSLNQAGYQVQLTVAAEEINSGNIGPALAMLREVAEANPESPLRLEANALMGEAIASAPANAEIDLEILFQAGQGAYFQERYQEAAPFLRQLITRLAPADDELGAKAYLYLARSLEKDVLLLEAAVAYQKGFQLYDEVEKLNLDLATGWRRLAENFRNADPRDAFLDTFFKDALDAASSIGSAAPDLALVRAARSDMRQAVDDLKKAAGADAGSPEARQVLNQFDRAIASWQRIENHSPYYDEAVVSIGQCEFQKFAWDPSSAERALQVFSTFLDKHVNDPQYAPTTPKAKQSRANMVPVADYHRGATHRLLALAGDLSAWDKMLGSFAGYEERNPDQFSFIGAVMAYRVEAYLALGRESDALAQFDQMTALPVSDAFQNLSSFGIYRHYKDKAAAAVDDEVALLEAQKQAVKYLHLANSKAPRQQWPNLLNESRLHAAVGEMATATKLLADTIERFGGKEGFTDSHLFYAKLDLIQSYLELGQTGIAVPILDELLASRPTNLKVKSMAVKIKAGFPAYRNGRIIEVPGEDTATAYQQAAKLVAELLATADSEARKDGKSRFESTIWWESRMQQIYIFYKWGKVDSNQKGKHNRSIQSLEQMAPDFGLSQHENQALPQIFRWLKGQN